MKRVSIRPGEARFAAPLPVMERGRGSTLTEPGSRLV